MRLLFAGTPHAALPSLRALLCSERHEILAVLTRPDAPAGRGRALRPSPVKEFALDHSVRVLTPRTLRDDDVLAELRDLAPQCAPVVAYGNLVPAQALAIPDAGWVNLHFSVLPAWRGAAPVQHAIWHGDDLGGASTFLIEEGLDTGPVFGVLTEAITPTDTAGDLLGRLAEAGAELLVRTLDALEDGTVRAEPQPTEGVTLAPKITTAQAQVRWAAPAASIDRQVRACTPEPGAWTTWRGTRLKLGPVHMLTSADLRPAVVAGDVVGTGTVDVRLGRVQPAGKPPMDASAWARGARLVDGEHFTT